LKRATRRAVFLDRDGVLNRVLIREGKPFAPRTLADFEVLSDAPAACHRLKAAGYLLIVVSNQPDVGRGAQCREVVDQINRALRSLLPIDDLRVCYHDDADRCRCRKPEPGLILASASFWDVDLKSSFIVGDRWRDVEAGRRAGCRTVFIDYGYREKQPDAPDYRAKSLAEAAQWILVQ
jgi:D-glycero-D-manno-heptose 1,7-bisphosphate phosphatase